MKKVQTIIAAVLLAGLSFTNNTALAVLLNKYTKEELAVNNIVNEIFAILFVLSIPLFIVGIIRDSKKRKNIRNFSMIKFIGAFILYLILSFFLLGILVMFFLSYIYFYPFYFIYVGVSIFLSILYLFAKISAKKLNTDLFFVLSILLMIAFVLVTRSI